MESITVGSRLDFGFPIPTYTVTNPCDDDGAIESVTPMGLHMYCTPEALAETERMGLVRILPPIEQGA